MKSLVENFNIRYGCWKILFKKFKSFSIDKWRDAPKSQICQRNYTDKEVLHSGPTHNILKKYY